MSEKPSAQSALELQPDAALDQLRAMAARVQADQRLSHSDVVAAAAAFSALDTWVSNGGFLPRPWAAGQVRR